MNSHRNYIQNGVLFLISLFLFLFVTAKSRLASFTIDESYTYLHYPHDSFIDIISFAHWYTNNHILNSLFMKYTELLFGNSELALRLPNIILMLVYMFYSYLLFKGQNFILACAMFILLCVNFIILDFFGMARGYGMSCGFMLMSLYHYIHFIKESGRKHLCLFHAAALLATLSHFTILVFYVALLLIYTPLKYIHSTRVKNEKFNFLKANKAHIFPLLVVGMFLFEPLRRLAKSELDFGGKASFYTDTVNALIYNTFQCVYLSPAALIVLQVVFSLSALIPLFIIIKNGIQNKNMFFMHQQKLIISTFLIVTMAVIIVLQHVLLGTDYPRGRFSIFLFPLFVIHLGFFMRFLMDAGHRVVTLISVSCLAIFAVGAFFSKSNIHSYGEWSFDCETKQMLEDLNRSQKANNNTGQATSLGVSWVFEPTTNFYRETHHLNWLLPVNREGINEKYDYCYIFKNELGTLKNAKYLIINEYHCSNTLLIKLIKNQ